MSGVATLYNKDNPFVTELIINEKLNKEGSKKDTRHFSISLKGSDIQYRPGDALYVIPENDSQLVQDLLAELELDSSKEEETKRFTELVNITKASNKLYKLIEAKTESKLESKALAERFNGYSLAEIIKAIKAEIEGFKISSNEVAENSSKLLGRAYSIASSQRAHPDEVQLCIARVEEEINGQMVFGVCSNYLSHRVNLNNKEVKIYLHNNDKFRLPENKEQNIIMVGPGTGIAPFRAFIEERNADRDAGEKVGKDWLFFGDQRAAFDYLYGEELEQYKDKYGLEITKAFSRDQEEKVYVQHKMLESADRIYELLESGAHFYVCGDARRMAKDVDSALREIVTAKGKDADEYMKELKAAGRYQRDIY